MIAVDDLGGDGVLQVLLDLAAQVPGAVSGGVGLLYQVIQHAVVPGEGNALLPQVVGELLEHDLGDLLEVVLGEAVEIDYLVHPVDEFGAEELAQGLHGPVLAHLVGGAAKAHRAGRLVGAARIGGHDDDSILKIHVPALGVGNVAIVQNLEHDVEHVGMGLLNLVEEDHAIGLAPHLLSELPGLVVAHVARGRADDAAHGKLLHKFGHVQPDEGLGGVEHVHGQLLDQFGLAHAGGAHKDKGHGLALGGDAHPAPPNGGGHGLDGLVLADDMALEPFLQMGQALILLLLNLAGGDLGPQLDDPGQVFHRQGGVSLGGQPVPLAGELELLTLEDGQPLIGLLAGLVLQHGPLLGHSGELTLEVGDPALPDAGVLTLRRGHGLQPFLLLEQGGLPLLELLEGLAGLIVGGGQHNLPLLGDVGQLLINLHSPGQSLVVEVHIGGGLVNEVDGLVGQETVGDVPLGHGDGQTAHLRRDLHVVIGLVVGGDTLDDLDGILDGGLLHNDRLEPALQGGVLFNILAVFREGGGADDLNLAPGQGGLKDIGGIHGAFGIPGPYQVVDLVNDQDNVAQLFDLLDEALHAAFKLAAELGARHQGGQVQQIDLLVHQLIGHVPLGDAHGKALGDGGFTHAGLTDQAGVVLLTAVEDLDYPLQLLIPADDPIQLAVQGFLSQGNTIIFQELTLGLTGLGLAGLFIPALPGLLAGRRRGGLAASIAKELIEEGKGGGPALVVLVVVPAVLLGHQALHTLGAAKGGHHLIGDALQIIVGDAHLLHHILNGLDAQFLGALEAETLVLGLAAVDAGHKNHGHVFMASGTKRWLHHGFTPSREKGLIHFSQVTESNM